MFASISQPIDLLQRILERPTFALLLLFLPVALIGHRAAFTVQDNSPEVFFAADRAAQQEYRAFVETFQTDETVMVELRGAKPDRPQDLQAIHELAQAVAKLPHVSRVASVADLFDLDEDEEPGDLEAEAVSRELAALPFYQRLGLYRPKIPALGLLVTILPEGPESRLAISTSLNELVEPYEQRGYQTLVGGVTMAHAAIDQETRRTMMLFMPMVVLLVCLVGLAVFRSAKAIIAMITPVGGAVAIGAGLLEIAGEPINLVSGVMPPLVLSIGFAGATHMVSHFASGTARGLDTVQAVRETVREKLFPTAFAFITTAVGFGSLVLADIRAVRVLGAATAVALAAALPLVTIGTPALLLILKPVPHMPDHRQAILVRAACAVQRMRWLIIGGAALVAVLAVLGLLRLETSVDGMELLGDQVEAKKTFRQLEAEGMGLYSIDLWWQKKSPPNDSLITDAEKIASAAADLEKNPAVLNSLGIHHLLEVYQYRSTGTKGLPLNLASWDLMSEESRAAVKKAWRPFWHPERGLRLALLTSSANQGQIDALIREAERVGRAAGDVAITGHFMMLIGSPGKLMTTLFWSLALTVLIITVLFVIAFRSFRLTASGMIANLFPVLVVVGLMGWSGLPLDVATIMVGSVAFGIAVDDTFHYLHHHKHSGDICDAARIAGQGIVATTMMLVCGLSVLGLSGFVPVMRFGLLTALAVFTALVVDALLLPAMVGNRTSAE